MNPVLWGGHHGGYLPAWLQGALALGRPWPIWGGLCARLRRYEEAEKLLKEALHKGAGSEALVNLGWIYVGTGRRPAARAAYTDFLAKAPDHPSGAAVCRWLESTP